MISVILEALENVDMIYIAEDKNHVSNSMEILCIQFIAKIFSILIFKILDAQDGSAMLMMTALDERSASERDVGQRETEGKYSDISTLLLLLY